MSEVVLFAQAGPAMDNPTLSSHTVASQGHRAGWVEAVAVLQRLAAQLYPGNQL